MLDTYTRIKRRELYLTRTLKTPAESKELSKTNALEFRGNIYNNKSLRNYRFINIPSSIRVRFNATVIDERVIIERC